MYTYNHAGHKARGLAPAVLGPGPRAWCLEPGAPGFGPEAWGPEPGARGTGPGAQGPGPRALDVSADFVRANIYILIYICMYIYCQL